MSGIEESAEINGPIGKAFAFTTDAGSWNTWQSFIPETAQTSQGPVGVGTTFRGTSRLMGRSMKWTAATTEYETNRKSGKNISSGPVFIEQHNTCTSTQSGLRFTIIDDVKVSGFFTLLSPVMVRSMQQELRKSLINVKRIPEAGSGTHFFLKYHHIVSSE